MRNRMIWGLAILIILIMGVSVFLLTRTTETEPEEVYNPLTPSEKEQVDRNIQDAIDKEKKNLPPIAEGDRQQVEIEKPQAEEKPVTVPSNTGAGIIPNFGLVDLENPILNKPIVLRTTNVPGIDIDWVSLSPEELADTIAKLERGEISAPEGYRYLKSDSSGILKLILDENGYPIIHKKGEPMIAVVFEMGFRPPPDVWEEYHKLNDRCDYLEINAPNSPEIRELNAIMDEMVSTYRGPLPSSYVTYGGSGSSFEGVLAHGKRTRDNINVQLRRQMGIEYLLTSP